MRIVRRISAVIIGLVYLVAGLLKLMDPVGAGLVVDEYFRFFHLDALRGLSGFAGSAAALIETVLGVALITGVWRRIVGIAVLAVTGFFTAITVILLIFNPPMDCGCFGEAVHLTHLQSFLKNVALLALWCLAFIPVSKQEPTRRVKYVSFGVACVSVCLFFLYSSFSLPLLDFTDYRPGAEIEDAGLYFSDAGGEYADSLATEGKVLAISVYNPADIQKKSWDKFAKTLRSAEDAGFTPLLLAASYPEEIEKYTPAELLPYTYFADRKTLLTLNRSNGGASYFFDGLIVAKWSAYAPPSTEKLAGLSGGDAMDTLISRNNAARLKIQGFFIYLLAVLFLI